MAILVRRVAIGLALLFTAACAALPWWSAPPVALSRGLELDLEAVERVELDPHPDRRVYLEAVGQDPQQPNRLYAATSRTGIHWSADRGRTWSRFRLPRFVNAYSIAVCPSRGWVYVGTFSAASVVRSRDGGDTWEQVSAGLPKERREPPLSISITSLLVDPSEPRRIFAGTTYHGLYVSEDSGESWSLVPLPTADPGR